jgi:holo-[acyl-carrier protein] synthase
MVIGIGTDICHIERIKKLASEAVVRVLTPAEAEYCGRYAAAHERIAGRFAAKEAILKALGTGWSGGLGWGQIEILPDPAGAPLVTLTGAARERLSTLGATRCLVSISHHGEYAVAFAIIE